MAYTISLTNGTVLTTVADGTINDTSSDIVLIGKNFSNYGDYLNENFVHILENFAAATAPSAPLSGQLWYDTGGNLKVYTGTIWKTIGTISSANASPSSPVTGNQWWDTTNQQLNVWNGSTWSLIGPAFTSQQGSSGVAINTIVDSEAASHTAVQMFSGNTLVGIFSGDQSYVPNPSINGFANIRPGLNLSTAIANVKFSGTSTNSDALGGFSANVFALLTGARFTGDVSSATALKIGSANTFVADVSGTTVQLYNNQLNSDIAIKANIGSVLSNVITVSGSTGVVSITGSGQEATSTTTGALRVVGGIGVTGSVVAGNLVVTNLTVSGATNIGSFTLTGNIGVNTGGTGLSTITTNAVMIGNGTSSVKTVSPAAAGTVLMSTGAGLEPSFRNITALTTLLTANAGSTISDGTTAYNIGYRNVPRNSQGGSYTLALADEGKFIYSTNPGGATITIPTNTSVPFPIGTAVTIINSGVALTVAGQGGVTLYQGGTTNTGNRTVATRGVVTIIKADTDSWYITGVGIS